MEIIKLLKDYSKNEQQLYLYQFLSDKLINGTCKEKIKNKKFMIKYVKPLNNFIISTTAMPCSNFKNAEI